MNFNSIKEWTDAGKPFNSFVLGDCMDAMREMPDNFVDLCICDPPYGLGERLSRGAGKLKNSALQNLNSKWDVAPNKKYFDELFRVSKHQIIWGGNYFELQPTRCILAWDKIQAMPTFSAWEYAWTSFDKPAKLFKKFNNENRIHPTQKPIELYRWILINYGQAGWKILDTHVGSASSLIACWEMGFDFVGFEIDKDYYESALKRLNDYIKTHKQQLDIFPNKNKNKNKTLTLF